jgi:hypothetical protein
MIQILKGWGCGKQQPSFQPLSISLEAAMEIVKKASRRGN